MKRPLPQIGAATAYAIGIIIRYLYIFVWHPATDYRYSFMQIYYAAGKNFRDAAYVPNIRDTLVPPGMGYFIGLTRLPNPADLTHPNLMPYFIAQLILSCLVPLIMGLIALELYDRRAALLTIAIASLYFPFIDYAGYFLAEGPFLFFLVLAFWLMMRSLYAKSGSIFYALGAGLMLGVAAAFKSVALAAGLSVLAGLSSLAICRGIGVRRTVLGGAAGLLLVLVPLSARATRLNEGNFCLIANDWQRAFVLGNCGKYFQVKFEDKKRNYPAWFATSSAAYQKGEWDELNVDFGAYDSGKALETAFECIRKQPAEACFRSIEHVSDLAFNNLEWPSAVRASQNVPDLRPWVDSFQKLFVLLLLFPACLHLYCHFRILLRGELPGDLLVLMPLIAIAGISFIFVGEPRYRVPFDAFVILLAVRQYCGGTPRDGPWPVKAI
jgi:4-amino-4-deoxy-L-arabinose transferase-like glycosyltransferase